MVCGDQRRLGIARCANLAQTNAEKEALRALSAHSTQHIMLLATMIFIPLCTQEAPHPQPIDHGYPHVDV